MEKEIGSKVIKAWRDASQNKDSQLWQLGWREAEAIDPSQL